MDLVYTSQLLIMQHNVIYLHIWKEKRLLFIAKDSFLMKPPNPSFSREEQKN